MSTIDLIILAVYIAGGAVMVLAARHCGALRHEASHAPGLKAALLFLGWPLLFVVGLGLAFYDWLTA